MTGAASLSKAGRRRGREGLGRHTRHPGPGPIFPEISVAGIPGKGGTHQVRPPSRPKGERGQCRPGSVRTAAPCFFPITGSARSAGCRSPRRLRPPRHPLLRKPRRRRACALGARPSSRSRVGYRSPPKPGVRSSGRRTPAPSAAGWSSTNRAEGDSVRSPNGSDSERTVAAGRRAGPHREPTGGRSQPEGTGKRGGNRLGRRSRSRWRLVGPLWSGGAGREPPGVIVRSVREDSVGPPERPR